jgi:predicted ester cyclase
MSSTRDAYERVLQLYNVGDLEGVVNSYAEDAILVTPDGVTAQGRAAIREQVSRDKAAFPDEAVALDVVVEQGDTIAVEYTWAGTHTGPFVMPDGTEVSPTGKRAEFKGMDLAQVRAGKIAVHHMYADTMALIRQLGLLPGGAST